MRRLLAITTLGVVALLALSACSQADLSVDATAAVGAKPVVVAIGDSIMKGHGLPAGQAWPALVAANNHWSLTNLACDGAGFLTTGDSNDCANDFAGLIEEAVNLHPNLILISGSSNDLGVDNGALSQQTTSVVDALRSRLPNAVIVGISTVWNDTVAPDQMDTMNEQVRTAVKSVNGIYLDIGQPLAGHRSWLQSDDVHPTATGQRKLATAIAGALRSAKLHL
jgi:acyl-CoA thioesterase-1